MFSYPDSFLNVSNLLGFVGVMGLAGLSFFVYRYSKAVFFGIWWFLITLFPVSNLIEIFNPLAERYLLYTDHRILPGGSNRYRRSGQKMVHPAGHCDGGCTDTDPGNSRSSDNHDSTQPRLAEQSCVVVEDRSKLTQQSRRPRRDSVVWRIWSGIC